MTDGRQNTECYRFEGDWYQYDRHDTNCPGGECSGCTVCHRHCTCRPSCGEHVDGDHPRTAPRCVGKVRGSIREIRKLTMGVLAEAIRRGVNSEAAVLAGPALDTADSVEAYDHRSLSIVMGRIKGDVERHSRHPLIVLGWWDVHLRAVYGQDSNKRMTVASAAEYLEGVLGRMAQDPDEDWPQFAHEIAACRAHLEAVLHASRRPETGAPCPTCSLDLPKGRKAPRLQKRHAEHADMTLSVANRVCELGETVNDKTGRSECSVCRGDDDTWHCPDVVDHWWADPDYRARVEDRVVSAGALTAAQLFDEHGIRPGTLRVWANRNQVKRHGRNGSGQMLYDVDEALAMHQRERMGA